MPTMPWSPIPYSSELTDQAGQTATNAGLPILGTTVEAFFSLNRLAVFLRQAPLGLKLALNLDGGPVACQAIAWKEYRRDFCGGWETTVQDGQLKLLKPLIGNRRWGLPIVLAVLHK
jgi:hypothetical protein